MKVLILGKGRIGKALIHYLRREKSKTKACFFNSEENVKNADLIISALPGDIGELGLKLALKHKKDFIDISDLDYEFYLENENKIKKAGILVIPFAGFSPGLINFICGREARQNKVKQIEISAGSLSGQKNSFPFLWCFEDLIEGHQLEPILIKNGKKVKVKPFSDYKKQKIQGINSETYLAEGLGSLIDNLKVKNMSYRIIRNLGFHEFFKSLNNKNLLKDENIGSTAKKLESKKQDNLTVGIIKIKTDKKQITWKMKSISKKNESLNSMQKITAIFPTVLAKEVLSKNISQKGLFFPEQLGQDNKGLFEKIISQIKIQVSLKRS
ncbi:MAG: hypothetical protein KJI70_01710 [Patescibacteria group bacterium]|nr:hypothetical protein [Patescibacteria group bacterium]